MLTNISSSWEYTGNLEELYYRLCASNLSPGGYGFEIISTGFEIGNQFRV